jgi:transaldolase
VTEVPAEKVVLEEEKVVLEAVTAVKEVSAELAEKVVLVKVPAHHDSLQACHGLDRIQ